MTDNNWQQVAQEFQRQYKNWQEADDRGTTGPAPLPQTKQAAKLAKRLVKGLTGGFKQPPSQAEFTELFRQWIAEQTKVECPRCSSVNCELTEQEVSWSVFSSTRGCMVTRQGRICGSCLAELKAKANKRPATYTRR